MEESPDALAALAGELALQGVKAFMFQEGHDPAARRAFEEIARLTGRRLQRLRRRRLGAPRSAAPRGGGLRRGRPRGAGAGGRSRSRRAPPAVADAGIVNLA